MTFYVFGVVAHVFPNSEYTVIWAELPEINLMMEMDKALSI